MKTMNIQALWVSHFSVSLNELKETFLKLKVSKITGKGFFCPSILMNSVGENGETALEAEWNELWHSGAVMPISLPQICNARGSLAWKLTHQVIMVFQLSPWHAQVSLFLKLYDSFSAGNFVDFCLANIIHELQWILSVQKKKKKSSLNEHKVYLTHISLTWPFSLFQPLNLNVILWPLYLAFWSQGIWSIMYIR